MRIDSLAPSQKVKGRWLAHLEDGTILRVSEREMVSFALYSGMELSEEVHARIIASAGLSALRSRALNLISTRPLSRRELVKKLTEKDEDPAGAEAVADWLTELGYLNDTAYAQELVRHYTQKGYGERKLQDELYRRGVPRELWAQALSQAEGPERGIDAFIRSKLRGNAPDPKDLKRVSDALARRGYRWDEIKAGLRRYGAEIEEA